MGESAHGQRPGHEELLATLSLEDKVSLLTGADYWHLRAHRGIGLRRVRTSDGPAGVRGPRWDERETALNVPAPVALAATWDPRRADLIGSLLAAECRRKGVDVLLAPAARTNSSAGWPPRTPGPSWSSTPELRSCCPGRTPYLPSC